MDEQITRRSFLRGVGASAVAGVLAKAASAEEPSQIRDDQKPLGPEAVKLQLRINGQSYPVEAEPRMTLLDVLRNRLQLTGAKEVCDRATCGACTVLWNGRPVYACMKLAIEAEGQEITTIEGLGSPAHLTNVQQAFVECDALMCGFCTPGFVLSLTALFNAQQNPSLTEIKRSCSGHLCRCGAYPHILQAAQKIATKTAGISGG